MGMSSASGSLSVDHEDDLLRPEDKPLPIRVCAAILVALSLGCWSVILYLVSLI